MAYAENVGVGSQIRKVWNGGMDPPVGKDLYGEMNRRGRGKMIQKSLGR